MRHGETRSGCFGLKLVGQVMGGAVANRAVEQAVSVDTVMYMVFHVLDSVVRQLS